MPESKKFAPNLVMAVAAAVGAVAGSTVVSKLLWTKPDAAFDKVLMQTASELNKTLPMMVDSETRLDNVIGGPGKVMHYRYTIVNHAKADVDLAAFIAAMRPTAENQYRTSPDMKTLREAGVTMRYSYSDKDGVFLTEFSVGPTISGKPHTIKRER